MYCTRSVTSDLIWVGADDRRLPFFEGVYGVPNGVSYNSYVLLDEKIVVLDTVDKAVSRTYFENLAHTLAGRTPDYLVISHMEPDHAATVEEFLLRYPGATVVCNGKIDVMLGQFFTLPPAVKKQIVAEGDVLSTGRHELTFVMAPMVHWPEVMMTYDKTDGILFSADAFGTFGALNGRLFNDETDFFVDDLDEARRYYTNIVGKYGNQVQAVLKKAGGLALNYVCPLHGYVWRSHFGDYLEKYLRWSSYTPEVKGVLIAYASVYGHTENTANILACRLAERGVPVKVYDTSVTPASYILSDAFKYSHLVLASTTYNAGIFVTMEGLIHEIVSHGLKGRKIALIENGSWAATSGRLMREALSALPNTEFIEPTVSLKSDLTTAQLSELDRLADTLCADILPAIPAAPAPVSAAAPAVDLDAFIRLTYGVQVLTTRADGQDNGCIINTAVQQSACDPKKVTISVIKQNHTCDMILKSGVFNVSILTEEAPFSLFQHFGFQSGRDVDKFAGCEQDARTANGVRYIPKYTNAVLSCRVTEVKDLETSTLFVADVTEARVLSGAPSCTYAYYHAHIKPKKAPATEQKEGYICKVCGYFHEGPELPEDFVCPLCKHGVEDFEYVPASTVQKQKGYICKVCGHFVPCDGELPADYVCPICHHGVEDFEPAEQ